MPSPRLDRSPEIIPSTVLRTAVIGDLSGSYQRYHTALKDIGLINTDNTISPTFDKSTPIIFLGDIIADRHTDGTRILRSIEKLRRAGYQIQVLAGNHEEYLIGYLLGIGVHQREDDELLDEIRRARLEGDFEGSRHAQILWLEELYRFSGEKGEKIKRRHILDTLRTTENGREYLGHLLRYDLLAVTNTGYFCQHTTPNTHLLNLLEQICRTLPWSGSSEKWTSTIRQSITIINTLWRSTLQSLLLGERGYAGIALAFLDAHFSGYQWLKDEKGAWDAKSIYQFLASFFLNERNRPRTEKRSDDAEYLFPPKEHPFYDRLRKEWYVWWYHGHDRHTFEVPNIRTVSLDGRSTVSNNIERTERAITEILAMSAKTAREQLEETYRVISTSYEHLQGATGWITEGGNILYQTKFGSIIEVQRRLPEDQASATLIEHDGAELIWINSRQLTEEEYEHLKTAGRSIGKKGVLRYEYHGWSLYVSRHEPSRWFRRDTWNRKHLIDGKKGEILPWETLLLVRSGKANLVRYIGRFQAKKTFS